MDGRSSVAIDSNATVAKTVTTRFSVGIRMPACALALLSRVGGQIMQTGAMSQPAVRWGVGTKTPICKMNRLIPITMLLLIGPVIATAVAAVEQGVAAPASGENTDPTLNKGLRAFLGPPVSLPLQQLWKGGGGTNIVTAQDGTVIAFQSMASNRIRRSRGRRRDLGHRPRNRSGCDFRERHGR